MAQQRMNVQAPVERLFAERWSTRAFDGEKPVADELIASCLEAARWAPSCYGAEPWYYIIANRFADEANWDKALESLARGNQLWAKQAPVLIVAAAEPVFSHNGKRNRWAEFDTGQATICLCLQASVLGLASHQMGGFDPELLKQALGIPAQMHVMSVTAIGYPGPAEHLGDDFQAMETAPRTRKALTEIVHAGAWGKSWQPPAGAGWEARYQETSMERLPWFHAGLDADFEQALAQFQITAGKVLDIGCGPGTQAIALAKRGFSVTASDVSRTAVESSRLLAEAENLSIEFHVDDVLDSKLAGSFDVILDRGIFHCFDQQTDQQAYLTTLRRLLKSGGLLLLKCFHKDETREQGPPGRYGEDDIRRFFADGFELLETHATQFSPGPQDEPPKALLCVLQRK
ncbi:MAG: nitroreductase family protein [Mariprofundus sp.]